MKVEILDNKAEKSATCYLVRCSISDYVKNLSEDFTDFHIQREYTNNIYLEKIPETIITNSHIPTISLVAEKKNCSKRNESLQISDFNILDGLQRTLRLKGFIDAFNFIKKNAIIDSDMNLTTSQILKRQSKNLATENINPSMFSFIINHLKSTDTDTASIEASIRQNIWLEVWVGLTDEEQVRKMLLLNAGHKAVRMRHQLELLFLGTLPKIQKAAPQLKIVREKEASATSFSKTREPGEFHFATIIASLIAFFTGKPITTNSSLISSLQDDSDEDSLRKVISEFTFKFSKEFVTFLISLENILSKYPHGTQWLGREVVLIGIFSAIGKYHQDQRISHSSAFKHTIEKLQGKNLNISEFETIRNTQDLSRINIGTANKTAIYKAFLDILNDRSSNKIAWAKYF